MNQLQVPELSVIIPVYNVEKYIERCCESLFNQTMKDNIEFIFIDDCSPDKSINLIKSIIKKYPAREHQVKIIHHNKNKGLAGARKTGIEAAQGKYLIHCDSDDWIEKNMYETMYKTACQEKSDMVICDYFVNYPHSEKIIRQDVPHSNNNLLSKLIRGDLHNNVWTKMIRKEIYLNFDSVYEEGVNMWEDVSVISRLTFYCNKISHISEPLYHYSQENINAYTQKWKPQYTDNILRAVEINTKFFEGKGINVTPLIQRAYFSILSNSSHSDRKHLLLNLKKNSKDIKIDYSIYSPYRKLLAWCLFNSHNILADNIMKLKRILQRLRK